MFASLAFAPPFIDTDRMTPPVGRGGGLSARVWIALAFIAAAVLWQLVRYVVKG